MPIKPISEHYSFTDIHPSVHDEESMTALELAGRLNGKLNECIKLINEIEMSTGQRLDGFDLEMEDKFRAQNETLSEYESKMTEHSEKMVEHEEQTIPATVEFKILDFIQTGRFDPALKSYLTYLEERVDALLRNYTPGSTTADAELIDIRVNADGSEAPSAGEAVRENYLRLKYEIDKVREHLNITISQPLDGFYMAGYPVFDINEAAWERVSFADTENYRSFLTAKMPCSPGKIFKYIGRSKNNACGAIFYSGEVPTHAVVLDTDFEGIREVTIPFGCDGVVFASFSTIDEVPVLYLIGRNNPKGSQLYHMFENALDVSLNRIGYTGYKGYLTTINGYLPYYDGEDEYHCYTTAKLPCMAGDKFIYRGVGAFNALSCVMYGYDVNHVVATYQYDGYKEVTIPEGVGYVQFSSYAANDKPITFSVSKVHPKCGFDDNPLYNKEIAINGDSIAAGDGYEGGFGKIIARRNHMQYTNIAKGGATVATGTTYADGTARHHISATIENMSKTADYIIVNGGLNDAWNNVALGEFVEGYTDNGDTRTFYGAFNYMCKQLAFGFLGKKVGYIFPHNCNSGLDTGKEYYTAAKRVLEKWGIPYLDLSTQLPPFGHTKNLPLIGNMQAIYVPDGVHPNEDGYNYYYCDKIESWLKTL